MEDSKGNLWLGQQRPEPEIVHLRAGQPVVTRLQSKLAGTDVRVLVHADLPAASGRMVLGGDKDAIAQLTNYVSFDFQRGYVNQCDAAIASVRTTDAIDPAIPGIGVPIYDASSVPKIDIQVQKTGRTTGHTTGTIKDTHYRTMMPYPQRSGNDAEIGFRDQVLCTRYSEPGDSGALVCDSKGRALGLHWAGSDVVSIFSPIEFVLSALGVQLWPPSK
jgi:hypothetical protein